VVLVIVRGMWVGSIIDCTCPPQASDKYELTTPTTVGGMRRAEQLWHLLSGALPFCGTKIIFYVPSYSVGGIRRRTCCRRGEEAVDLSSLHCFE
jgi:hypothetical protein